MYTAAQRCRAEAATTKKKKARNARARGGIEGEGAGGWAREGRREKENERG